jgi:AhpD family alkylhydroperoxidase
MGRSPASKWQGRIEPGQEFDVERIKRGEYRLLRRQPPPNEGLVNWLMACPEKGYFRAFLTFTQRIFADGALPSKTKQLIAVEVAHVTLCPYCIRGHTKLAWKEGVTEHVSFPRTKALISVAPSRNAA